MFLYPHNTCCPTEFFKYKYKQHEENDMKGLNKGALAMVLAGSVTFSVSNILIVEQAFQRVSDEHPIIISRNLLKENRINKGEETKNNPTPTAEEKAPVNENNSDRIDNQQDTNTSKSAISNPASTKKTETTKTSPQKATATTKPPTNSKVQKTTTTPVPTKTKTTSSATRPAENTTATKSTENTTNPKVHRTTTKPAPTGNTRSSTQKTTNHGQQVSQDAKEKAASHRDQKENNGKKN
jgi:hypothetical protein